MQPNILDIGHIDNTFIESITKGILDSSIPEDYIELFSYCGYKSNSQYNIDIKSNSYILDFFKKYDTNYSSSVVYSILVNYINAFLSSKDITKCPNNLFSSENIDLMIKHKLFFKRFGTSHSVFETLMLSKTNIDYFGINLDEKYIPYYIPLSKTYTDRIVNYSNNYALDDMNFSDIEDIINYICLIINLLDKKDIDYKTVIESNVLLFNTTLEVLLRLRSINREYLENPAYMIENGYVYNKTKINKLLCDIENSINTLINKNKLIDKLVNSLNSKLDSGDTLDTNSISILSMLPLDNNIIVSKLINKLPNILLGNSYSIYDKIQFILNSNWKLFEKSLESLCYIYRDIEKYNEYSGFSEKLKVREKIISILGNYLSNGAKITIDSLLMEDNYITASNYIVKILEKLVKLKDLYDNKYFKNPLRYSQNILISLLTISNAINKLNEHYIFIDYVIKNSQTNTIFISKTIETIYNIIKFSVSGRLYCYLPMFKDIDIINNTLAETAIKKIDSFYNSFFGNINNLLENEDIIKYYRNNPNYIDNNDIENTKNIIGKYYIVDTNINVDTIMDRLVNILKHEKEIYRADIPDEYIDPLLMVPIDEPVECPESRTIVDRVSILNHLVYSETDPFTNLRLTKTMLIEHNNLAEVKDRCIEFKNKFNIWKSANRI